MGPQEMLDRAEVKNKWKLTPLKNFKSPRLTERMWRTALGAGLKRDSTMESIA